MLLGAALHDIGKCAHPEEITQPGNQHEMAGPALLISKGLPHHIARFARTHARWETEPSITLEDLFVALADTCWKGQRHQHLEQTIIQHLQTTSARDPWEIWLLVDQTIELCGQRAEQYLAWQNQFPVTALLEIPPDNPSAISNQTCDG